MINPPSFGKGLDIASTAVELLTHIQAFWTAAAPGSVTVLPERRIIPPGDPRTVAWDCEQLTVALTGIGFGPAVDAAPAPSPRAGVPFSVESLRHVILAVTLVRCTPVVGDTGQGPSADELHTAGLIYLRDSGMLSQAMVTYAGKLRARLPKEANVQCGAVDPVGPNGGFHALETSLAITVPELV